MRARRGATDLAGVLALDKPSGLTSHDVVTALRRASGERRIGHAGTLDPMATGLLLVLIGRATRLERYLSGHDKTYLARISFGAATDTLDAEGTVVQTAPIPSEVDSADYAREVLAGFLGTGAQVPPSYSAIKVGGAPAYRTARRGEVPELAARDIVVHEAELLGVDSAHYAWDVRFAVSKGTYVRSLADDIGRAAGTFAHLSALRRTAIGGVGIDWATGLDEACGRAQDGSLRSLFLDVVGLLGLPIAEVPSGAAANGRPVPVEIVDRVSAPLSEGLVVSVTSAGEFLGVYVCTGDVLRAETVFDPGLSL